MSRRFDGARQEVAAAARRLAEEGLLIGTAGNVSVLVEDHVAVTATGTVLAEVTAEQVSVVDRAGRVVAGDLEPTSEIDLHLGVYDRFAGQGAASVVHTHAPVATAMSCVLDELPCIHYQQLLLGGAVRVAPYATFGTPELAAAVLVALEGRSAALMANHGSVTFGGSVAKAVESALLLEWLCSVYRDARLVGTPRTLDQEQQDAVVTAAIARRYGTTHTVEPTQEENQ